MARARLRRGVATLALLPAIVGPILTSAPAQAGPLNITSATSTPVTTAQGDGSGPGSVTVASGGSISLSSGVPLTINSSNDVTINGSVNHDAVSGATGVLVQTTDGAGAPVTLTSGLVIGGAVSVPGPDEEDLDTVNAANIGVRFAGGGTFKGNFTATSGSSIAVGGNNSFGVLAESTIDGNVSMGANFTLNGANGHAMRFLGRITGDADISGGINPVGLNSEGAAFADIGKGFFLTGSIATGARATFDRDGRVVDPIQGGSALRFNGSIGEGIFLQGNGLTEDQELTQTPATDAPNDTLLYTEAGNATTLVIGPRAGGGDVTVGQIAQSIDGARSSLLMRGVVQSTTTEPGRATSAISISGSAAGAPLSTVTFAGNMRLERGDIQSVSVNATARGIDIGDRAFVPGFINTGDMLVRAQDDNEDGTTGAPGNGGGNAFGIIVAAGGGLKTLLNTGNVQVDARGRSFSAFALVDNSGTLTNFENTGTFQALIRPTSTGRAVAADLSRSSQNIAFFNSGTVIGSIRLGSGADELRSTAGTITGDIDLGGGNNTILFDKTTINGNVDLGIGNHTVTVRNGTTLRGGIGRGAGTTNLAIADSKVFVPGGKVISATEASITGASELEFGIDGQSAGSTGALLGATGRLTIDGTVKLSARLAGVVRNDATFTLISAGQLQLGVPVSQIAASTGSFIYDFRFRVAPTNPNAILVDVDRKSATDLGLGNNLGNTYERSLDALAGDSEL
ncbi:MAG: hypothetical protein SFV21_14355, partial [Rhodospirillaceae bacterium]|nr:hypothetical protein [Rhodospirillaceae bacterium]